MQFLRPERLFTYMSVWPFRCQKLLGRTVFCLRFLEYAKMSFRRMYWETTPGGWPRSRKAIPRILATFGWSRYHQAFDARIHTSGDFRKSFSRNCLTTTWKHIVTIFTPWHRTGEPFVWPSYWIDRTAHIQPDRLGRRLPFRVQWVRDSESLSVQNQWCPEMRCSLSSS